jgi:Uma2 family endonuclease
MTISDYQYAAEIVAVDVSLDDYMEHYAADFCEWVEGVVIKMSPAGWLHNRLVHYLYTLIEGYFELRPVGMIISQPFVMRLPQFPNRRREPDLLIRLHTSAAVLHDAYLDGPADICIEVVSEESMVRDHGEKFQEYERGGVKEYWIVDPLHKEGRFYRLDASGRYTRYPEDEYGNYQTPALPGLMIHVPILWLDALPGPEAVARAIRSMLE